MVVVTAVACSSAEGAGDGDGGTTVVPTPSIVIPKTQPALKPATDCSKSTEPLQPESDVDGVQLDISTDPSLTSLLVKNTGSLSVLVTPDSGFTTRLVAAPYASPKDEASKAALAATAGTGSTDVDRGLPAYLPKSQVFVVPPQWAVCGLTDDVRRTAAVRYLRDKRSSAEYFVAKGLADQLLPQFDAKTVSPTLQRCTKATLEMLKVRKDLLGVELYAEILDAKSTCRAGYKALLGNDERAAQRTGTAVLNLLERTARLLETSKLYEALAQ
ncbi:hypothetical protein AB0E63_35095 [Kribbella sp. NPDC026596]|uniref:hypothetical protein n=1 Tax=Kribbella sp. NPDC026596 TaxID=3155122 RepID=UPI0033D88BDD